MNSDPLSESIPTIGNGNIPAAWSMASITHRRARFGTDRFTVHPVATSVIVNV